MDTESNTPLIPIGKIVIIDLGESRCKVIVPVKLPVSLIGKNFNSPKIQRSFFLRVLFNIGNLHRILNDNHLKFVQLEILIPRKFEYLALENDLKNFMGVEKKIDVKISRGEVININMSENDEFLPDSLGEKLKNFHLRSISSN